MTSVPLMKQSKRAKKEYYASHRGSWNGVVPVTKVIPDKRAYDRKRAKQADRGSRNEAE